MNIAIATVKSWNITNAKEFKGIFLNEYNVYIITEKEELSLKSLNSFEPDYIMFPHWSWIIPKEIYEKFTCIVFHMTDLPFGRGGSPLQNLIVRGYKDTKISAIKVDDGIDTGDIYLKKELSLTGTADEIYKRASKIIFNEMILDIIKNNLETYKQNGETSFFKRRKKNDGEIENDFDLKKIYDYTRMLDAEGYPSAFMKYGNILLKFKNAKYNNNKINAIVEISIDEK